MHAYCKNTTKGEKCQRDVAKHALVALHEPTIMALMKQTIFISFLFHAWWCWESFFREFCSTGALSSSWSDCLLIQSLLEKICANIYSYQHIKRCSFLAQLCDIVCIRFPFRTLLSYRLTNVGLNTNSQMCFSFFIWMFYSRLATYSGMLSLIILLAAFSFIYMIFAYLLS